MMTLTVFVFPIDMYLAPEENHQEKKGG